CSSLKIRHSPKTVEEYSKIIKYFLIFLESLPESKFTSLDDLILSINDRSQLLPFIEQQKLNISQSTVNSREIVLCGFFNWLTTEEAGHIKTEITNPYRSGKLITRGTHNNIVKMVTRSDLIKLLNGYHNESERCFIHFLFDTGLRISEAINLKVKHLPDISSFPEDTEYYKITVPGAKGVAGRIKYREAIISAPVLNRILMYHKSYEYITDQWKHQPDEKPVFLSVNSKELNYKSVFKQMKNAAKRSGLDPSKISPHKMRHSCAYYYLVSGLGKSYIDNFILTSSCLGHSSFKSTETYVRIPPALISTTVTDKHQEAERIFSETFLPAIRQKENRGHTI
ncbi:site-specific integrase, partial [bacterium]